MNAPINILIIDDDNTSRKIIGRALEGDKFEPHYAVNGEEGLEKAAELVPDIIILDVEMPGMNGYEVCEHIRAAHEISDIPVVFVSPHSGLRERKYKKNNRYHPCISRQKTGAWI